MTGLLKRSERGAATFLMVGVLAVVLVLGAVAMVVGGYVLAHRKARVGADLAALSGAVAFEQGREPCPDADRVSRTNGVRVADCEQVGDQIDFVVTVRAVVRVDPVLPGLPDEVDAWAHAGPAGPGG